MHGQSSPADDDYVSRYTKPPIKLVVNANAFRASFNMSHGGIYQFPEY